MSVLQPTASKTGLLIQCPRPFEKGTPLDERSSSEAAEYGTRFHRQAAQRLAQIARIEWNTWGNIDAALEAHVEKAVQELLLWMAPTGNPWGKQFHVTEVESSRALAISRTLHPNTSGEAYAIGAPIGHISTPTSLSEEDGAHSYDMQPGEIGGTADAILESDDDPPFRIVLDHKTGEWEGDFIRPAQNEQMRTLAMMWGANGVAILHSVKDMPPVIYAEGIGIGQQTLHRAALRSALLHVDSGYMRPGPECARCPARGQCPAKQGEVIEAATALVSKTLAANTLAVIEFSPGRFHQMLGEMHRLQEMAKGQLKTRVRDGEVIERPDGKTLCLETKHVERISKKSILEAYGKEAGEQMLQTLRDTGALELKPQEELRAK